MKGFSFRQRFFSRNRSENQLLPQKEQRIPLQCVENGSHLKQSYPLIHQEESSSEPDISSSDDDFDIDESYENFAVHSDEDEEDENQEFDFVEFQIGDPDNAQDVVEYENIVYANMRKREGKTPLAVIESQDITGDDREALVEWLDRIHYKAQLSTSTLYCAVGIFDRFCCLKYIDPDLIKIYGAACLIIASKIEDNRPLSIRLLIKAAKGIFRPDDIKQAELDVTNAVQFDFSFPTPLFFFYYFIRFADQTQEESIFTRYVMEVCLKDASFIDVKPSVIAAVAFAMAQYVAGKPIWTSDLEMFTNYDLEALEPHILNAHQALLATSKNEKSFIRMKYSIQAFYEVSSVKIPEEMPALSNLI